MARQTINTGTVANDNTGDTMRNAGTKINANFSEIYTILGGDSVTPTTTMSFGTNTIVAEGSVDDAHETTLAFTNPTADRTITFPDETGIVQLTGGTQSLTSAILTTPQIQDTSSNHKYIFAPSELDSDTTVNLPLLTDSDTFSFIGFTETLTNKTLTSPVLTTPKFADAGFIADANGNEQVVFQTASSAVNHVEVTNAATGAAPAFNAVGSDTNVSMSLAAKGTGSLNLNSKINYTTETLTGTTVAASAVKSVTVHNAGSAVAASLINGTVAGQIKKFVNIGAGAVTLTPATYAQGTTIILAQHDNAELLWTGSTWYDLGQQTARNGATLKIGTATSGLATTIGHGTSEVTIGDNLTVAGNATVSGVLTGLTVEATGDTTAGDNAAIGYTATEGLILTGQGSTNDVTIKNDADADVIEIPTGTVNVTMAGNLTVAGTSAVVGAQTHGAVTTEHGAGAIATSFAPITRRYTENGIIITKIHFDLTALGAKGAAANDVIGLPAGGAAYIGRNVVGTNGIIYKAELVCIELPAIASGTVTTDIDIATNASATLAYDGAAGTAKLINSAAMVAGEQVVNIIPALTANHYFYVVEADTAASDAVFNAGQFILTLYGHAIA